MFSHEYFAWHLCNNFATSFIVFPSYPIFGHLGRSGMVCVCNINIVRAIEFHMICELGHSKRNAPYDQNW